MISKEVLEETIFNTIKQSSCCISPDVHGAFEKAIATEKAEISKKAFEGTLQSLDLCAGRESLACPDTGWPLFFIKVVLYNCPYIQLELRYSRLIIPLLPSYLLGLMLGEIKQH